MAMLTQDQFLGLVWERLNRLAPIERDLAAESQRAGPAYGRWLEGSAAALAEAGFRKEAQRLFEAGQRTIVFELNVSAARATLESLAEQIHSDPKALGLRRPAEPKAVLAGAPRPPKARVPWPWIPAAAAAGALGGLYGRAPLDALAGWLIDGFRAGAARGSAMLSSAVDALTPGPPLSMPTWVGPLAFWVGVAVLGVAGSLLVELIADNVRRDGPIGLWRSRQTQRMLLVALSIATVLTALAGRK